MEEKPTTEQQEALLEEWKNQAALEVDEAVYGLSIVDEDGKRVDPRDVSL